MDEVPEQPDGSGEKDAPKLNAQGDIESAPPSASAVLLFLGRWEGCRELEDPAANACLWSAHQLWRWMAFEIGDAKELSGHGS